LLGIEGELLFGAVKEYIDGSFESEPLEEVQEDKISITNFA